MVHVHNIKTRGHKVVPVHLHNIKTGGHKVVQWYMCISYEFDLLRQFSSCSVLININFMQYFSVFFKGFVARFNSWNQRK